MATQGEERRKARRTQRETQWYQAVSQRLTSAERERVMADFLGGGVGEG